MIETTKQIVGPEFTFEGFPIRFGLFVSDYLRGNHVVDYDPARHLSFVTGSDQKWHGSFAITPDGTWAGGFVIASDDK